MGPRTPTFRPFRVTTALVEGRTVQRSVDANFLVPFGLALGFIYMALAAQFESFVHPITIMVSMLLAIPFGSWPW